MGSHLTGLTMRIRGQTSAWIQFALATPVVVWAGWPFFERGARSLVTRNLNMFTPIAMGVGLQRGHYPGSAGLSTGVPQDGRLAAIFAIADPIKPTTAEAVRALQAEGVRLVMMTSDNGTTALAVARRLGIDDVEAEVLPQDRAAVVEKRRREGHRVAMAGDGVNDAPALAAADVGVAMGAGADVAIETAGLNLLRGDLQGLVKARRLSRAAMRHIRMNRIFAFAYNAAGVFYPAFGLLLSPQIAAAAMALSSVSVIGNALGLRSVRL